MQEGENPTAVLIFRCHHDLEVAASRCPGGELNQVSCAEGYMGYTCSSCTEGYGMASSRECLACEDSEASAGTIVLLFAALIGIAIFLGVLQTYWIKFPWRHVVRCAAQPCRIMITYSQITTQVTNKNNPIVLLYSSSVG